MPEPTLTRRQINKILSRHRGSKARLARLADVELNTVSTWLAGGTNANLDRLGDQLARELDKADAEAGHVNGKSVRSMRDQARTGGSHG